jgi:hypothetical protein
MRADLDSLGYPPSTVKKLDPAEAHFLIANKVKFQPKKPAHIKHSLDDGAKPIILGGAEPTNKPIKPDRE